MRIGQLAGQTGASVRSLRYYEEQGLLTSTRSPSGQRTYTDGAIDRVRLLKRLYTAGLSSSTIAELLPCVDSPSAAQTDDTWARLLEERARIDAQIAELLQTRDALDAVVTTNRSYRETYIELVNES